MPGNMQENAGKTKPAFSCFLFFVQRKIRQFPALHSANIKMPCPMHKRYVFIIGKIVYNKQ